MDKKSFILAALAPANGGLHSPVQIQKLIFLLDDQISKKLGGPFYRFEPYDYGPFDKDIYAVIDSLEGFVEIISGKWSSYRLTDLGQVEGEKHLNDMEGPMKKYVEELSDYVRKASFTKLVLGVYTAYPHMRENSVFKD